VLSESYAESRITKARYELSINSLTLLDRARILYNHLWHSALAPEYIDELYAQKRYGIITRHRNYNPRLIAFVLDSDKVAGVPASEYWAHVQATLGNPQDVWRHYFAAQLNQDCRDLVYMTVLNGGEISESELRGCFFSMPAQRGLHPDVNEHRFSVATRHAAGSVLDRRLGTNNSRVSYSLFNPSIADYVWRYLAETNLWEYYLPTIRTVSALRQLHQLKGQPFFGVARYTEVLRAIALAEIRGHKPRDQYSLHLASLLVNEPGGAGECADLPKSWLVSPDPQVASSSPTEYLELVTAWRNVITHEEAVGVLEGLPALLADTFIPIDEPDTLAQILRDMSELGLDNASELLRARIIEEWSEQLPEVLRNEDHLNHYLDHEETTLMERELRELITGYLAEAGVELTPVELSELTDTVELGDIIYRNISTHTREADSARQPRQTAAPGSSEDSAIDDLFDRSGQ
jgi:hypothetical protein